MKIFFIVSTSQFSNVFYVHSKYDQLPQMYSSRKQEEAFYIARELNEKANKEFNDGISLTENKGFSVGVDKFLTFY